MANENQPGNPAPQHISSQTVPSGNHAPNAQPLDKQVLEIARREKELRKQQESLKGAVTFDSLKERAQKDRNGLLKELGLTDLIQEDPNDPVAALKKQLEDMQRSQAEKDRQEQESKMYESFRTEFSQKSDEFELSSKLGRDRDVFEAMLAHEKESGERPDWTQLARQLEDNILAQLTQLKGSKKISEIFGSPENKAAPQRHPLDTSTTLTSSDRPVSQPANESAPTPSRQQLIDQLSKQIKFNT